MNLIVFLMYMGGFNGCFYGRLQYIRQIYGVRNLICIADGNLNDVIIACFRPRILMRYNYKYVNMEIFKKKYDYNPFYQRRGVLTSD